VEREQACLVHQVIHAVAALAGLFSIVADPLLDTYPFLLFLLSLYHVTAHKEYPVPYYFLHQHHGLWFAMPGNCQHVQPELPHCYHYNPNLNPPHSLNRMLTQLHPLGTTPAMWEVLPCRCGYVLWSGTWCTPNHSILHFGPNYIMRCTIYTSLFLMQPLRSVSVWATVHNHMYDM